MKMQYSLSTELTFQVKSNETKEQKKDKIQVNVTHTG